MSHVYLGMLHAHKVVPAKTDMFRAKICLFLHRAQKILVLCETLCTHIEHGPLHVKKEFLIFLTF
jgi:hypothetical protein